MKKKFIIFAVAILCLLCCGCEAEVTKGIRHAGFTVSEARLICDTFVSKEENAVTSKARYLGNNFIITDTGVLYELSLGQTYSNNQNCRQAVFNIAVKALLDNNIVKGSDNKYYTIVANSNLPAYSEINNEDKTYQLYQLILGEDTIEKVVTVDNNNGKYYVLKNDGNVYEYVVNAKDNNTLELASKKVVYSSNQFGRIIDFNYSDSSPLTTYIRTDNSIYRNRITNKEECGTYVDKNCDYALYNDVALMEYKDYILGYDGSLLLTTYGREFTVAG